MIINIILILMGVCGECKAENKRQQKKSDKKDMIDGESMKYKLEKTDEKGMVDGRINDMFFRKSKSFYL